MTDCLIVALETDQLIGEGRWETALCYMLLSIVCAVLAVFAAERMI